MRRFQGKPIFRHKNEALMTSTEGGDLMFGKLDGVVGRALACAGSSVLIADAKKAGYPIIYANPAFCRLTGYAQEEILGRNCGFLQNDDTDQPALSAIREALARREEVRAVLRNYRKDGSLFWNCLLISPITDESGEVTHFIGVQTDITEEKRHEQQLAFQAGHDLLTGLPNQQLIKTHLEQAIRDASASRGIVALLVLTIDHFKLVNSTIGYEGADALLQEVAERLRGCIGDRDSLSRHGDEFTIMLRAVTASCDVAAIAERLSAAMAAPFRTGTTSIGVTCSIGIALYPQDSGDAAALLRSANMALHRARELGRNNMQFFSREISERSLERVKLETALRAAVEANSLTVFYQPLVDLQTGRISGLEALLRWTDPELGAVPPTRFIAIAEECGIIEQLGEQVLRRACQDMRAWENAGIDGIRVAVNLSPRQFRDPQLAEKIGSALAAAGVEPQMLCLEITENVLMLDTPASQATLAHLRSLGIDLVLDDFGTGYSSLNYLKKFAFDKVKIDCSFVSNITTTDSNEGAIATAVVSMAHSLGIRVVAEGVETEVQCDFLRRNMCDEIQGFLFSPALSADDTAALLREERRLPDHLLRLNRPQRTLLIVDDEVNIVSSLKRLLRRDNYHIFTANSGMEGLEVLARNEVDVIVSDQRMPGMTGVEFLGKAKEIYPDTVRIVLSGYTELQSVTDAVNQGAIYKFLMKPWDDTQLREHIDEAFRRKEMADENRRLTLEVRTANFELAAANRKLEGVLRQQQQQIRRDEVSLDVVREVLQQVPAPAIGLDEDNFIAFVNTAAQELFRDEGMMLGADARTTIPDVLHAIDGMSDGQSCSIGFKGSVYRIRSHSMGQGSESRGKLLTLTRD
jgi:diguanylate cyclase (GGDEF)-like protein/PAS domain S-box-containing protein